MNSELPGKPWLMRYLLGDVPEAEASVFELRYFSDPAVLVLLHGAEAELIEAYLSADLDREQLRLFEERFLTAPGRRQRVEIARSLRRGHGLPVSSSSLAIPGRSRRWAAVIACSVLLGVAGLSITRSIQERRTEEQLRRGLTGQNGGTVRIALGSTSRGSGNPAHSIPRAAFLVEFVVPRPVPLPRAIRVVLRLPDDAQALWSQRLPPAQADNVWIPALLFGDADYILAFYQEAESGSATEVAAYSLRVTRLRPSE